MNFFENKLYIEDTAAVAALSLPWEKLQGKRILVSGASGMIASFFIDVVMKKNAEGLNCKIYALGRNEQKAGARFPLYWEERLFEFVSHDINKQLDLDTDIDYVMHMASNTHPLAYATDPIGTVATNIIGTKNMLDFAAEHNAERFVFSSSNEIYGENRGDVELFGEKYCGYIDPNTLRAGYPESKRAGEALCQAYIKQKGLDTVIPRFTRTFGPSLLKTDTKALSQFIQKAVSGEDIVLKSAGTQYYSYLYAADSVSGLLYVLLKGRCGEAYNVADESCDIKLRELAQLLADIAGTKVVYDIPDELEASGYSKATKARLDGEKIKAELGWEPRYDLKSALERTVIILRAEAGNI